MSFAPDTRPVLCAPIDDFGSVHEYAALKMPASVVANDFALIEWAKDAWAPGGAGWTIAAEKHEAVRRNHPPFGFGIGCAVMVYPNEHGAQLRIVR